jgi:hypothetical protein
MSKNPFQLQIPRREPQCSICNAGFEPDTDYFSVVWEDENEEMLRRDFCDECSKKGEDIPGTQWQGKVPSRREQRKQFVSLPILERAMEILRIDVDEDPKEAFFLALFLKQRKKLFQKGEIIKDGSVYWIFEARDGEETFCLQKPDFDGLPLEEMQKKMTDKLNGLTQPTIMA